MPANFTLSDSTLRAAVVADPLYDHGCQPTWRLYVWYSTDPLRPSIPMSLICTPFMSSPVNRSPNSIPEVTQSPQPAVSIFALISRPTPLYDAVALLASGLWVEMVPMASACKEMVPACKGVCGKVVTACWEVALVCRDTCGDACGDTCGDACEDACSDSLAVPLVSLAACACSVGSAMNRHIDNATNTERMRLLAFASAFMNPNLLRLCCHLWRSAQWPAVLRCRPPILACGFQRIVKRRRLVMHSRGRRG